MNPTSAALIGIASLHVALFGLVALRGVRVAPRAALLSFLAASAVVHALAFAAVEGASSPTAQGIWFAASVGAFATIPAFASLSLTPQSRRRRSVMLVGLAVPGALLAALGFATGWRAADLFTPPPTLGWALANAFLVACLAIALAESLAVWRRSLTLRTDGFLVALGVLVLIVGGPAYAFEFPVLGLQDWMGTNPASPVAGGLFAASLLRADSLRFRALEPASPSVPWSLPPGAYLIEEARPHHASGAAGSPGSGPVLRLRAGPRRREALPSSAPLPSGRRCAAVMAASGTEFFARHPAGCLFLEDASYVVLHSGVREAVEGLRVVLRAMPPSGRLIIPLSNLTDRERRAFRSLPATWLAPGEFGDTLRERVQGVLGAEEALPRAAEALGKRVEDLTPADLPALRRHLGDLLRRRSPPDGVAGTAWARTVQALGVELEALWRSPPESPSRNPPHAGGERILVRAGDVPLPAPQAPSALGSEVRDAFVGSLGNAAGPVYRKVMAALGRDPLTLRSDDLPEVARLADVALDELGAAIDVEVARRDLMERRRKLRTRLETLSRDTQ